MLESQFPTPAVDSPNRATVIRIGIPGDYKLQLKGRASCVPSGHASLFYLEDRRLLAPGPASLPLVSLSSTVSPNSVHSGGQAPPLNLEELWIMAASGSRR